MRATRYLSVCALVTLAAFIYLTFDYLPLRSIMADNADVLFAEDIARDLNAGGQLFDWRLSQVTYLFPDILFARILSFAGVAVGSVGAAYQVMFGACLLALIYAVTKVYRVSPAAPLSIAALLYLSAFAGDTPENPITVHFGLIGEHCGMLLQVLAALVCFWQALEGEWPEALSCAGLFTALFLGVISDSLAAIIAMPPMALWLAIAWRRKSIGVERLQLAALTIAASGVAGKLFSYLNPFPQDRDFLHGILAALPGSILPSVRQFAADLVHFAAHSFISAVLLALAIAAWVVCLLSVRARGLNGAVAFLALTVVVSLPLVILLQLGLGLYGGIALARHWAPAVYLAIVLGTTVAAADCPRIAEHVSLFVLLSALGLGGQLAIQMKAQRGHLAPAGLFADLVACLEAKGRPGPLYLGDYWISRPVKLYSGGRFGVVPYVGDAVFTNQSNLRAIRGARPEYLITGYGITAEPFVKTFGPPREVTCEVIAAGWKAEVLDFSNSEAFKAYARGKAAVAN